MKNVPQKLTIFLAVIAVAVIAGQVTFARLSNPATQSLRWIASLNGGNSVATINNANQANLVSTSLVEVPQPVYIDAICYSVGSASAGNVRLGLYGPIITEENVTGAPLRVESASTAQTGISSNHCVSVATTSLAAGRYYFAYQADNAGGSFARHGASYNVDNSTKTWNMAYGAFPTVATTSTISATNIPAFRMRVVGQ